MIKADTTTPRRFGNKPPKYQITQPDLCVAVMAHMGAKDTFQRHIPFWLAWGGNVIVFSPDDDKIGIPGHQMIAVGKKGHDGINSIIRFKETIDSLLNLPFVDRFIVYEYDSFSTSQVWPVEHEEFGGIFWEDEKESPFTARFYPHPPLFCHWDVLFRVHQELMKLPHNAEQGFWDRVIGLAIQNAGAKIKNLADNGGAFSRNTIHPAHHPAVRLVGATAQHWHGVKDQNALEAILSAKKGIM